MRRVLTCSLLTALGVVGGYLLYRLHTPTTARDRRLLAYLRDPQAHADWRIPARTRCGDAPFLFPTDGYVGYLWGDSFRPGHHHSGVDIFGGTPPGVTPVYAAYDGYLTRLPDWKSSLILRIPSDPLQPGRTIWLYHTHLAAADGRSLIAADFPPGTSEVFVPAGTLLGYQGNYSGNPLRPVGVHLHLSIVRDDGRGGFLDERRIANTLDPSPYFGMELNAQRAGDGVPRCGTITP